MSNVQFVLVTGATGFIGAHVVDELLRRGCRVRATARSRDKAEKMLQARTQYRDRLEFAFVGDLTDPRAFDNAVKGVGAIVHSASPVVFDITDNEKELMVPAIQGTKSIIEAAKKEQSVRRIVYTSSFASVINPSRPPTEDHIYTDDEWNPITYEQAKHGDRRSGYRGGKKYAELALWDCIKNDNPHFDLVVICPPMVFGPVVHPLSRVDDLNDSCLQMWKAVLPGELPPFFSPIWVNVRDLAVAHAEALLRPEVSNQRFLVAAPEQYSYQKIRDIARESFDWAKKLPKTGNEGQPPPTTPRGDGSKAARAFGLQYKDIKSTVIEAIGQYKQIQTRTESEQTV